MDPPTLAVEGLTKTFPGLNRRGVNQFAHKK
jgi:hypothetical protein